MTELVELFADLWWATLVLVLIVPGIGLLSKNGEVRPIPVISSPGFLVLLIALMALSVGAKLYLTVGG